MKSFALKHHPQSTLSFEKSSSAGAPTVMKRDVYAVVIAFPIPFSVHIITNMNIHPTERALASF